MEAIISRSTLSGSARVPPSKSYTHRAMLASAFSSGATVTNPLESADTRATGRVVDAFGGRVEWRDGTVAVWGFDGRPSPAESAIDCGNSGTTMRLATATAALADGTTRLTGDASLRSRPQGPLLDAIEQLGGETSSDGGTAPLSVTGPVDGGRVVVPGDVSSQFVTALLVAGAVTDEGVAVELETPLKSAPYVDVTLEVLDAFDVSARETAGGYRVSGGQAYTPPAGGYAVPGDVSSGAYLLAAGAVAADERLSVEGIGRSAQGDLAVLDVLDRMGASVAWNPDIEVVTVEPSDLDGVTVDVGDTPDLLPTVAAMGAVADGETRIENCEHVRYKETDRVAAMAETLAEMGATVEDDGDALVVRGGDSNLRGTRVDGRGDHRVVMSLAVAALAADGVTTIEGAEHVDVSFPGFFDVLADLGASVNRRE